MWPQNRVPVRGWEPNLFWSGRWRGLPVGRTVDNLAHTLKPPLGAGQSAFRARREPVHSIKAHLYLCVKHIYSFYCP